RIDGLVVHASHPISTGKLEGFNNRIKVAKRIGYGYRDEVRQAPPLVSQPRGQRYDECKGALDIWPRDRRQKVPVSIRSLCDGRYERHNCDVQGRIHEHTV
ncbi:MAG TPA: transposase, partial [Candidatus Ornithospirochaeta stercorigallinarum]|nr:transposase [Candidatus Ornithospirochaeta stercorigallinarum]